MKWFLWLWILPLIGLSWSIAHGAGGGTKAPADVTITQSTANPNQWTAMGSLGDTRYLPVTSPGTGGASPQVKEIGCWVTAGTTFHEDGGTIPGGQIVYCRAVAANPPNVIQCQSGDPALVAAVAGLKGDSMLTFTQVLLADPARGLIDNECITITVENGSKYFPKAP
jgi:hypothetical protein